MNKEELSKKQCTLCGQPNCDKLWLGKPFHKKCKRKFKRKHKGMLHE